MKDMPYFRDRKSLVKCWEWGHNEIYTAQKNKHINLYDLFFSKEASLIFKHVEYEKVYKKWECAKKCNFIFQFYK